MRLLFFCLVMFFLQSCTALARPYGEKKEGVISTVDGQPAICLPLDETTTFPLGWAALTESNTVNPTSWVLEHIPGTETLQLKKGRCVVFGVNLENYRLYESQGKKALSILRENKIYQFRINNFMRPENDFIASFCTAMGVDGRLVYVQFFRRISGRGSESFTCEY